MPGIQGPSVSWFWILEMLDTLKGAHFSLFPQGRDASDQHIIEVVLKMLQGEFLSLNN